MRTLITGGNGYLGAELVRQAQRAGHQVTATYRTRPGTAPGVDWRFLDVRRRAEVVSKDVPSFLTQQVARPADHLSGPGG